MPARRALAAIAAATAVLLCAPAVEARPPNEWRPIVYVHGFEMSSKADCNQWARMDIALRSWGFNSQMVTVGYYSDDVGCGYKVDNYPTGNAYRHLVHSGSTDLPNHAHTGASGPFGHDNDTQIQHIAYHWAWMVYENWSRYGTYVDVVGHSMGGLIARYALAQTQRGHGDFPPYLRVDDIVTLGSPHKGATYWARFSSSDQANQMVSTSNFMHFLRDNAQNPQGLGDTEWTTVGAGDDDTVDWDSAMGMGSNTNKVGYYSGQGIEHGEYQQDVSDSWDRHVKHWYVNEPYWHEWHEAPHVVGWSYFALCCENR